MHVNAVADSDMWAVAAGAHDEDQHHQALARATVALTGTWQFLAAAESEKEFEHRLALVSDQIAEQTPPEILDEVTANLRSNFQAVNQERLQVRTAAFRIEAAKGTQELPQAYVHVHKHAADGDEYHQIDHVAGPSFLNPIGREVSREDAMVKARQFSASNGLPIYENGRYVEGSRQLFRDDEEFYDHKTGRWVPASELPNALAHGPSFRDGMVGMGNGWQADLLVPESFVDGHWQRDAARHTAHQSWTAGGTALSPFAGIADEAGRARRAANWGDAVSHEAINYFPAAQPYFLAGARDAMTGQRSRVGSFEDAGQDGAYWDGWQFAAKNGMTPESREGYQHGVSGQPNSNPHTPGTPAHNDYETGHARGLRESVRDWSFTGAAKPTTGNPGQPTGYQPDQDQQWRYWYGPTPQQAPAQGGQPTAPSPNNMGVVNQVGQTSVGPDGFPADYAQGEGAGGVAKIQDQLTPGTWAVTPGTEWPMRPNAGSFDQTPVYASRQVVAAGFHQWMGTGERNEDECIGCGVVAPDFGSGVVSDHGPLPIHCPGPGGSYNAHHFQGDKDGISCAYCGHSITSTSDPKRDVDWECRDDNRPPIPRDHPNYREGSRRRRGSKQTPDTRDKGRPQRTAGADDPIGTCVHCHRPIWEDTYSYNPGGKRILTTGEEGGSSCRASQNGQHSLTRGGYEGEGGIISNEPRRASRRTAGEGVVPTPGPNPNYFSQGTQGIAGDPNQFPQNPSGDIEPKTDNRVNDIYGAVPPQVSTGTSEGTVDGGGYSRQAARGPKKTRFAPGYPHMTIHPAQTYKDENHQPFALHPVMMHESPDETFTVGHWPASSVEQEARNYGRSFLGNHGYSPAYSEVPVHRSDLDLSSEDLGAGAATRGTAKRSRLGFSRGAGERTADRRDPEDRPSPYEVSDAWNPDVSGHQQVITPEQAERNLREVLKGARMPGSPKTSAVWDGIQHPSSVGVMGTGLYPYMNRYTTKTHDIEHQYGETVADGYRDAMHHATQGYDDRDSPGFGEEDEDYQYGYKKAHEDMRAEHEQNKAVLEPLFRSMREQSTPEQMDFLRSNPTGPSHYSARTAVTSEPGLGCPHCPEGFYNFGDRQEHIRKAHPGEYSGPDDEMMALQDIIRQRNPDFKWASRQASTNGQIVGKCDHCKKPVRYHTERGGHLRHLHNGSDLCADGKVALAMITREGGYELRWKLPAFVAATLEIPTPENPTGRGQDEYRANTAEGLIEQHPMQSAEDRHVNTPQTAPPPIKQGPAVNSPAPGQLNEDGPRERDDDEEDDDDDE